MQRTWRILIQLLSRLCFEVEIGLPVILGLSLCVRIHVEGDFPITCTAAIILVPLRPAQGIPLRKVAFDYLDQTPEPFHVESLIQGNSKEHQRHEDVDDEGIGQPAGDTVDLRERQVPELPECGFVRMRRAVMRTERLGCHAICIVQSQHRSFVQ
jgi:hypothetical protein